jgi:hypothetical protein
MGAAEAAGAGQPFRISGCDVRFPHSPYGVQKVFINQVIKAVDQVGQWRWGVGHS